MGCVPHVVTIDDAVDLVCMQFVSNGGSRRGARHTVNRAADSAGIAVGDNTRRISVNQGTSTPGGGTQGTSLQWSAVHACVSSPMCAGRALARALKAKQAREQEAKIRYAATRAVSGSGADPLQGIQLKDLGRPPTVLEEEIYKHMAEVAADPTVFTAYMPPVERSHPSVHPAYRAKKSKRSKGVSWMYAISVRFSAV